MLSVVVIPLRCEQKISFTNSDLRPVPLSFSFCSAKGLHPLLNDKGTALHPNCKVWRPPKGFKRKNRLTKLPKPESPPIRFVIAQMAERKMLPAIYFIFSRRGCDKAVKDLSSSLSLVSIAEKERIKGRLELYIQNNPKELGKGYTLMP